MVNRKSNNVNGKLKETTPKHYVYNILGLKTSVI